MSNISATSNNPIKLFARAYGKSIDQKDLSETKLYEDIVKLSPKIDKNKNEQITYEEYLKSGLDIKFVAIKSAGGTYQRDGYKYEVVNNLSDCMYGAAKVGRIDIMKALIVAGADINERNSGGERPLGVAIEQHNIVFVKALIDMGADVNLPIQNGSTTLMMAALYSDTAIVQLLLDAGAEVNAKNEGWATALMLAVQSASIVDMLIKAGADVNAKDLAGNTALSLSKKVNPNINIVGYLLLEAGAKE